MKKLTLNNWEFKPMWLRQYLVVFPTILVNSIRYRSLTMFTATNPDIPVSGFFGESKVQILDKLSLNHSEFVASYQLLPPNLNITERLKIITDFVDKENSKLPIVIKPNIGQQGHNVAVLYSQKEILNYLKNHQQSLIIQKYISGFEYSIFYIRYPDSNKGEIYSITEKILPHVVGNDQDTVLQLVRKDPWLAQLENKLPKLFEIQNQIPKTDEIVSLGDIGSHCRGTRCLDATGQFCTPELVRRIDQISQDFGQFYFGRYDIRVNDPETFKNGKGFQIVELNGVTGEPLHVYDPKYTIWDNYKSIIELWSIAYKIGAYNHRQGSPITPFRKVMELWQIYG